MKAQDLLFTVIILFLFLLKRKWLWPAGLLSFAFAGTLFLVGNLFTAQRLSWYASGFLSLHLLIQVLKQLYKRP